MKYICAAGENYELKLTWDKGEWTVFMTFRNQMIAWTLRIATFGLLMVLRFKSARSWQLGRPMKEFEDFNAYVVSKSLKSVYSALPTQRTKQSFSGRIGQGELHEIVVALTDCETCITLFAVLMEGFGIQHDTTKVSFFWKAATFKHNERTNQWLTEWLTERTNIGMGWYGCVDHLLLVLRGLPKKELSKYV